MSKVLDKRYKKLKKIFRVLIKNGLIKEGEIIDYDQIIKDLYYINLLLFKTYKIFTQKISKNEKVKKISMLKDPRGNKLFNKKIAKKVVELYQYKFINTINKIKRNRIKKISMDQRGGNINYKNNMINIFLDDITANRELHKSVGKLIYSISKIKNSTGLEQNDFDDLQELGKNIITKTATMGPEIAMDIGEYFFNWVFFPLYQLENLPLVGFMFEIPLDIMGIILDNSDVLLEFIGPLIPLGMDLVTDGISLVPGIGTGSAAVGLGLAFLEEPIEWLFADGLDVVGLYLNIQRKQWGLAYLSAMEVFPQLPSMIDMVVTNMYTANKHISKVTRATRLLRDTTQLGVTLSAPILQDPLIMIEPKNIWEKVIYPNRKIIPIINKIPFEKIEKFVPVIASSYEAALESKKTIEKLITQFLDQKKKLEEIANNQNIVIR